MTVAWQDSAEANRFSWLRLTFGHDSAASFITLQGPVQLWPLLGCGMSTASRVRHVLRPSPRKHSDLPWLKATAELPFAWHQSACITEAGGEQRLATGRPDPLQQLASGSLALHTRKGFYPGCRGPCLTATFRPPQRI